MVGVIVGVTVVVGVLVGVSVGVIVGVTEMVGVGVKHMEYEPIVSPLLFNSITTPLLL
jgi:hypothetical protein